MNTNLKRTIIVAMGLALLLTANGLIAQSCSTKTTVGRYVVTCDGFLTPGPNAPLVPAKILATATADNNGTFSGPGTISLGGTVIPMSVVGTEKINPDCTGTISYNLTLGGQQGPPLDITFVVSDGGSTINGLVTDQGAVFSCTLKRFLMAVLR